MKNLYLLLIVIIYSCKNKTDKSLQGLDSVKNSKIDTVNLKYYTNQDSVIIITERGDSITYLKNEYNELINSHPEFFAEYQVDPDRLYYCGNDFGDFASEAGQDNYYILYSHFLKKKNELKKYDERRQNIIKIYTYLNELFGMIQNDGTYFGHQYSRILGYAEYSIYWYSQEENFTKTYDIARQKELYIKSLKQIIHDEDKVDKEFTTEDKIKKVKELNIIVDSIGLVVTDIFYLRRAQEFQYRFYEYH